MNEQNIKKYKKHLFHDIGESTKNVQDKKDF